MTKQELEAKIRELNGLLAQHKQTLLANDGNFRDLNAQLVVYQKWLASLAADKAPVPATNGKVEVPRHDVSIGDEEVHHQIAA